MFSSVVFSSDVPEDVRERLSREVETAIGNRNETEVTIENFSEEDDIFSFTLSYGEKSVSVVTPSEYLSGEIKAVFYYDESLFEEGERLDYIYRGEFSSVTMNGAKRGQNYALVGEDGKTEALLVVDAVHDDAVSFKSGYSVSPLPGMKIERINDFSLSLRAFSSFDFTLFGGSLSLSYSTFCYPVTPFVQAAVIYDGAMQYHVTAGLSASFFFSSVWPSVPFVKNLRLDGEFSLGVMYGRSSAVSSEFAAVLSWTFSRMFSVSAGIVNYRGTNCFTLGLGGKL